MTSLMPRSNFLRTSHFGKAHEVFGVDIDEALAYSTSKMVWIRDRWVGALYYSLVLAVLVYIVGVQVLCRNEHFEMKDVQGLTRLWYSHPTLNNCDPLKEGCVTDFTSFKDLPYCDEYLGTLQADERGHCEYQAALSMIPGGVTDNRLFIPTAVELLTEVQQCEASQANNYSCPDQYTILNGTDCLHGDYECRNRGNLTNQFFYVADVKNFKVRFTSSFERDGIRGNSLMLPAFVGICEGLMRKGHEVKTWSERKFTTKNAKCEDAELTLKKIPCEFGVNCAEMHKFDIMEDTGISIAGREWAHRVDRIKEELQNELAVQSENATELAMMLPQLRTRRLRHRHKVGKRGVGQTALQADADAEQELDPAGEWYSAKKEYSDNWGDVFTVGRLLQLAGADLDLDRNMDGWTTRQAGTALEVVAVYNNLYPILSTFGYTPVKYHYQVNELILPYVSRAQLAKVQPADYPKTRVSEVQYGVLIHFKVGGRFGFFSFVYLLLMLTAAFALTATATTVTDLFYLYISGQQANFFHLKYEVSPDFSDMWECGTCHFLNLKEHDTCRGVPKFMCPRTTPVCGAPRPVKQAEEAVTPDAAAS